MKGYILAGAALAILSAPAPAATLAYLTNELGGRIELHDRIASGGGPCHGMPIAKAWSGMGEDILGCWEIDESSVMILWFTLRGQELRSYPLTGWTKTKRQPTAPKKQDQRFNKES